MSKSTKSQQFHTDHAHASRFSQIRMQNRKLDTNSITSRRNLKIAPNATDYQVGNRHFQENRG